MREAHIAAKKQAKAMLADAKRERVRAAVPGVVEAKRLIALSEEERAVLFVQRIGELRELAVEKCDVKAGLECDKALAAFLRSSGEARGSTVGWLTADSHEGDAIVPEESSGSGRKTESPSLESTVAAMKERGIPTDPDTLRSLGLLPPVARKQLGVDVRAALAPVELPSELDAVLAELGENPQERAEPPTSVDLDELRKSLAADLEEAASYAAGVSEDACPACGGGPLVPGRRIDGVQWRDCHGCGRTEVLRG